MARIVSEIMTVAPETVQASAPARDAARAMRDGDLGAIVVLDGGALYGIVTDRDVAIRLVAEDRDPATTIVGDIASRDPTAIESDRPEEDAVALMRERALRRLPVVEDGQPVGILTLGDLAVERDSDSALADISASDPNR
ncbi:MAG: CBS domain-containing protein [Thermoleophilaceae bacterium]|nr:CBS domain-containing protein [Thermoleophilaceae bacterium]